MCFSHQLPESLQQNLVTALIHYMGQLQLGEERAYVWKTMG